MRINLTVQSTREIRAVVVAPGLLLATMAIHRAAVVPIQGTPAVLIIRAIQAAVIIMVARAAAIMALRPVRSILQVAEDKLLDRSPLGNDC